jgi:hypothetical protein
MVAKQLQGGAIELSIHLVNDRRTDLRRYNAPTANEVGALMVGGDVDEADARDIVIRSTNGYFQRVSPYTMHTRHYITSFSSRMDATDDMITSH